MKSILKGAVLLGFLSIAAAGQASAETSEGASEMRPYVSELFGYTFENDARVGVNAGRSGTLSFGDSISQHWGWEVGAFYGNFDKDGKKAGSNPQREYGGTLDGLFFYDRDPAFSPYFVLSGGGVKTKLRGGTNDSSTDPMAAAGIGFIKYFTLWNADFGFRADLRYREIFFGSSHPADLSSKDNLGETVVKVGLVIPIGARAVAEAPAVAPTPSKCADSDGDGVCDSADLCPGTPAGTMVDAKGCPKLSPDGAKKKFDDIHFAFDKSDLAAAEKTKLDADATAIDDLSKKYGDLKVDVSGHTDWVGTDGYNQGLSERRANAVKSYLLRKGVSASRINTYAFGESKPIATNETAEGRALNRRVEVQTHE